MVSGRKLKNTLGANPSLFFFLISLISNHTENHGNQANKLPDDFAQEGSIDFKALESDAIRYQDTQTLQSKLLFLLNDSGYCIAQTQLHKECVHYNVKLSKKKKKFFCPN